MSDRLVDNNRMQMKFHFGIRVGCGLEITRQSSSALCALIQALFACEEFRIKIILIARHNRYLLLYESLGDLFKHMVIRKQASLIPSGILNLIANTDENNVIAIFESMIQEIRNYYTDFVAEDINDNNRHATDEDNDWPENERNDVIVPNCASETFRLRFIYICENQCNIDNNEMWFTTLEIDAQHQQPIDIQEEFEQQVIETYSLVYSSDGCPYCKSLVVSESEKPNALIIELSKHRSLKTDIKCETNDILVEDVYYSLFACICYDQNEQIYTCYAKLVKMWCSFKGRYVQEIPVLTLLNNVCVLFYKKKPSDDYSIFSKQVDTTGVIPPLDLSSEVQEIDTLKWNELNTGFKTVNYTAKDRIIDERTHDIIRTGLPNRQRPGVCFLNSTLQALYHCSVFRKYILECDNRCGDYHKHLKNLFTAMNNRDVITIGEWHEKFCYLIRWDFSMFKIVYFYRHLILFLHKEVQELCAKRGATLYARQIKFRPTERSDRDYKNVLIGREDMSSSDSWMRCMIENDNSYVLNMFTNQSIECKRCRSGHKTTLKFRHSLDVIVSITRLTSLQNYIDCYGRLSLMPNTARNQCNLCPEFNSMYQIGNSSTYRSSDILVFSFKTRDEFGVYFKPNIELERYLYVCGNKYMCVAVIVEEQYLDPQFNHSYTFARSDDGFCWWQFNDQKVSLKIKGFPQNNQLASHQYIGSAFYEKESAFIAIKIRNELSYETTKTFQDIDVIESGIQATHPKPLSLLASSVGLINLYGNTSYMNSVLQSLYHCFEFRKYIIFDQQCNDWNQTHYQLKHLFVNLSCTDYSTVNPEEFWKAFTAKHRQFKINGNSKLFLFAITEDLLGECIERFEESCDLKFNEILDDSWIAGVFSPFGVNVNLNIVNLFGVIYRRQQYCKSGTHLKVSFEQKYFLELKCNLELRDRQSIQSLINAHLMDSNVKTMECNEINCDFQTELSETLYRAPNILIIVLKLFINERFRKRINYYVDISESVLLNDEHLTLRSYVCCVGLEAVQHNCYAKLNDSTTYYCFNNSNVYLSEDSQRKLSYPNSYILFYEKI